MRIETVSSHGAPAPSGVFLELDLWRLQLGLAVGAEIEEVLLCEAEHAGEQSGRETLDPGIVFLHRVVAEAPRRGDLVLQIGQLGLQLLEIGVGLEIRIGLRQRKQLAQRAGQHVLGGGLLRRKSTRLNSSTVKARMQSSA